MTEDEVRAAAERLVEFHERFAPLFGKEQAARSCLHLRQRVDGLPRAQEHRADRPECRRRSGVGAAEVHQYRSLGQGRRPGRGPGRVRRRLGSHRRQPPDRHGRGGRRERFRQEGEAQCRRGPAAQRPARQGGQLPGRGLPRGRHPRRRGAAGSSALFARGVGARTPRSAGTVARRSTSPRRWRSRPSPRSPRG